MYPTESKQMVYNRVTAAFKLHPKTAKPMSYADILEHQATVIKQWDDAMKRKHYKQSAEVKAAEEAKEQLLERKKAIAEKKASLEDGEEPSGNGRPVRKTRGNCKRQKRVIRELEAEEEEAKQEEEQLEKKLKDLEETAVHADGPLRTRGGSRRVSKKLKAAVALEPPVRDTAKDGAVYKPPGEDFMMVTYYKTNLLCSLGPFLKNACKNGTVDGVDLDSIDKAMEDSKQSALVEQYTVNLYEALMNKKGKKLNKTQLAAIQKKATPKDVDYSSIINPACKKIAICLDFVDKMEFKAATGNIQYKLATPALVYASLRTWLNEKEIETLALSSAYVAEFFDKNKYDAVGKVVAKQFKAEDKRQLDVMLHDIQETFKLTNRK